MRSSDNFGSTFDTEEVKRVKELENLEFDLNNESHDSDESTKSEEEVEVQAPIVRRFGQAWKQPKRYIPPNFHPTFYLFSTEEYPRTIKEAIDSIEGELWKKAMEEET